MQRLIIRQNLIDDKQKNDDLGHDLPPFTAQARELVDVAGLRLRAPNIWMAPIR